MEIEYLSTGSGEQIGHEIKTVNIDSSNSFQESEERNIKRSLRIGDYLIEIILDKQGRFIGIESIQKYNTGLSMQKRPALRIYAEDFPNEE